MDCLVDPEEEDCRCPACRVSTRVKPALSKFIRRAREIDEPELVIYREARESMSQAVEDATSDQFLQESVYARLRRWINSQFFIAEHAP